MEWRLPENWVYLSDEEHVRWHTERVEREEPVYEYLEEQGIWSYLEPMEIQGRLECLRAQRKRVETMITLWGNEDFGRLQEALGKTMGMARDYLCSRARILTQQFSRPVFTDRKEEKQQLLSLREKMEEMLEQAEFLEVEIVRVCDECHVDWAPFMESYKLRR